MTAGAGLDVSRSRSTNGVVGLKECARPCRPGPIPPHAIVLGPASGAALLRRDVCFATQWRRPAPASSLESARGHDGVGLTVSAWTDEDATLAWKRNAEHAVARTHGRTHGHDHFELRIAKVERAYGTPSRP